MNLSIPQLVGLAANAGFSGDDLATAVAIAQLRFLPIGARDGAAAPRTRARARELVVVVGVGHGVVETELLAGRDGSHGHEQDRPEDAAIRFAGVVHEVGVVER